VAKAPHLDAQSPPQKKSEPRASGAHPDASADADAEELGQLRITADPRATVEISGSGVHRVQQTPVVGLRVPAGKYQLVFRNETFGAPVNAAVVVLAGATRSAHADFRQAEPTVTVR